VEPRNARRGDRTQNMSTFLNSFAGKIVVGIVTVLLGMWAYGKVASRLP
jgi:hypothetical protein